jgi:hypothetical protein
MGSPVDDLVGEPIGQAVAVGDGAPRRLGRITHRVARRHRPLPRRDLTSAHASAPPAPPLSSGAVASPPAAEVAPFGAR